MKKKKIEQKYVGRKWERNKSEEYCRNEENGQGWKIGDGGKKGACYSVQRK